MLPSHSLKLGLNVSTILKIHHTESVCDLQILLFDYPSMDSKRRDGQYSNDYLRCESNDKSLN